MAQLGLMIELNLLNITNSTETILFDLVNTIIQGVQVLEYFILIYSFSMFLYKFGGMEKLRMHTRHLFCEGCTALSGFNTTLLVVFLVFYFAMLLVSPSLYIRTWRESPHLVPYIYYYTGTQFVTHITSGVIRSSMIMVTLLVRVAWTSACQDLPNLEDRPRNDRTTLFGQLTENYNNTGHFASSLHLIFQGWFVLQWVTYFIATTVTFALLFDTLIVIEDHMKQDVQNVQVVRIFAYLIYYVSALAIPYYCGITMNIHHRKYREELEWKQRELISQNRDEMSVWIMQNANLIPENPKYLFTPSLCGLSIPLNSAGHSLTIVLTLLAFVLGLISKWANTID